MSKKMLSDLPAISVGVPAEKAGGLFVPNFFRKKSVKRFSSAIPNAASIKKE